MRGSEKMSTHSEVFMSNGSSYQLTASAKEVYEVITHSDGKPLDHIHSFETANGETVYLHSSHIVSIIEHEEFVDQSKHLSEEENNERKAENLEATKKFKEDLDENME